MKTLFITDPKTKTPIEVTDLPKALEQAQWAVETHENCKHLQHTNPSVIYFKTAHAWWQSVLAQLLNLNNQ